MSLSITSPLPDMKNKLMSKMTTKNVLIAAAVVLILFVVLSKRKIPPMALKLVNNIFFDILMVLLVLYTAAKHEPIHAVLVAVVASVIVISVKLYSNRSEHLNTIDNSDMTTIPPYTYSPSGSSKSSDNMMTELLVDSDDPVMGVTDKEMESLFMPLKDAKMKDNKLIETDFSELLHQDEVCKFAKHQFQNNMSEKKHFKKERVEPNDKPFSTLAPLDQ